MASWKASLLTALLFSARAGCMPTQYDDSDLLVQTNLFTVKGAPWPNATDVLFFGGIPYAEPPTGSARWRPPITKRPENETIDASWFGPSCIQYSSGAETVYTKYLSGFLLTPGQEQSEDCLTLNIWTPRAVDKNEQLPVMIWIHGGGFTSGGAASPYKYGDRLARDQNVIVVAMNYRLNIFGYPNAAALDGRNLNPGLLDQRKAVEWVYNNIHAFGGDADQMILFGQSAGGMAVDKYTYAWASDPLVKGFIAQSGTAGGISSGDKSGSNFSYVASQLGCSAASKDEEFACMQKVDATAIINIYNKYNASTNGGRSLGFSPAPDNQTSFSNYTDLQARGLFAKLPTVYAMVDDEGSSLLPYSDAGPNQTAIDAFTRNFATCPGAQAALSRAKLDVPVWRTRYFGEWPNLNPLPWLGSYHSSDIPMVFGTSDLLGPDTEAEKETSAYMQGAWAAFAKEPETALEKFGWPLYDPDQETLVKLGFSNSTDGKAVFGKGDEFDGLC